MKTKELKNQLKNIFCDTKYLNTFFNKSQKQKSSIRIFNVIKENDTIKGIVKCNFAKANIEIKMRTDPINTSGICHRPSFGFEMRFFG